MDMPWIAPVIKIILFLYPSGIFDLRNFDYQAFKLYPDEDRFLFEETSFLYRSIFDFLADARDIPGGYTSSYK